jgi:hypothetical protein
MKKLVLLIALFSVSVFSYLNAQVVIEDFESITMNLFSGGTNGALDAIANPDTAGNNSMYVGKMVRGFDGDPWAGWYADLNTPIDAAANKYVHLLIWKPRISPVDFKYENPGAGTTTGDVYPINAQTLTNGWEELVFDMTAVPGEYTRIVLIPDFENPLTLTEDITLYFDNIYANDDATVGSDPVVVFEDFEHIPLNLMAGGDEDNSSFTWIVNPDMSVLNYSYRVIDFLRDKDGVPWGGFFSATPIDITDMKYVHVKVWKPRISPVKFKIEKEGENHEIFSMYPQTVTDGWQDMVFDFSEWTGEWTTIVFMPDFEDPLTLTEDIHIYFDDIILSNNPAPAIPLSITVDMTDADPFDPATDDVYLSGDLAGWPMPGSVPALKLNPDPENPMMYTLAGPFPVMGPVNYKFFRVIDGTPSWDNGEWNGDPNRVVVVTGETSVMNVWGDKPVQVSFNVDMENADPFDPATDDIYIAGDLANGWAQPGSITYYKLNPPSDKATNYWITLTLYKGDYSYKYFRVIDGAPSWDNGEWAGDPNRTITADTTKTVYDVWGVQPAGVNDYNAVTFTMFPNPVNDMLNIQNLEKADRIEIYNMAGSKVLTMENINSSSVTINTADLNKGMYMITVYEETGVQATKFMKN